MEIQKKNLESKPEVLVLTISGKISAKELVPFSETLDEVFQENRFRIIMDLTGLEFVNSMGIGKLVVAHKKCTASGGKLVLCGINSKLMKLFSILCLDGIFPMAEDLNEAEKKVF
ncbi:MAG: hypothetical protein CVV64_10505 [Candidatus Wallbacteria bacterium HGW-Wallbacteria-1]|jgi:anti-sigma B factor antagonist|uniref:Anti-sigma factor antagonist n=1 Tax=Candidatus Wallbacteria bacterium HGW-Wallbacteria-1 TaxID=2013854 RepID=A0A2N1PP88_9BACT|nr:MAG: hypothetical protein CVV64_10505 [Candidatus Wallbacteria bacterium HGW-Wallbacteria-1]